MSVIKKETIDVRRVGTALIGGDFTGNARGDKALDIQMGKVNATRVASGIRSVAIGYNCIASGLEDTAVGSHCQATGSGCAAFGHGSVATGVNTTAVGNNCTASGSYSVAVGRTCEAVANDSCALGYNSLSTVERTTNICGAQIVRKAGTIGTNLSLLKLCGVEVVLMSGKVNMKEVGDQTAPLTTNCKFWLNEIGIIATSIAGLVTQPTVRYGITGDLDKHNAAAQTTALTATGKREIETPLVPEDGETSLTGGVTIAADADTFEGRFYWKGMLVEDE